MNAGIGNHTHPPVLSPLSYDNQTTISTSHSSIYYMSGTECSQQDSRLRKKFQSIKKKTWISVIQGRKLHVIKYEINY